LESLKIADEIIEHLKNIDNTDNFANPKFILIDKNPNMNLWILFSEKFAYVIRDKGYDDVTVLLKRPKELFRYKIINDNRMPRLYIDNTNTTLPIDTRISGSTESLNSILQTYSSK